MPRFSDVVELFLLGVLPVFSEGGISRVGEEGLQPVILAIELWFLLLGTQLHTTLVMQFEKGRIWGFTPKARRCNKINRFKKYLVQL